MSLFPRKRTSAERIDMSVKGQKADIAIDNFTPPHAACAAAAP